MKDLRARQKELEPLAAEYKQVQSAIQALEQANGRARSSGRGDSVRWSSSGARRGRPRKGEPTRSDQFLALTSEEPGITIGDGAKRLSIQPNYLSRIVAQLAAEGTIERRERRIFPGGALPAT